MPRTPRAHPRGARTLSLAAGLRRDIETALGAAIAAAQPVAGGCISPSWHARLDDGRDIFIKGAPPAAPAGLLAGEALSLRRLRAAQAARVPDVLHAADSFLLLEWLPPAPATPDHWRELGASLARLHRTRSSRYGWEADNFIGSLPQRNPWTTSWPEFWVEHRLRPQLQAASARLGSQLRDGFDALLEDAAPLLAEAEADGASLLHGDLWHGNVHMSTAGPALIDPSAYYGHREVDLAMARLFGGFPRAFFAACEEAWPLLPHAGARVPLYQLYYLLVHVNLFGGAYVAQTAQALAAAHAAIRRLHHG